MKEMVPYWFAPLIGKNEEQYREIYSNEVKIIDVDFEKEIYNLGLRSNLIVSLLSTVLVELYGYHKKILVL